MTPPTLSVFTSFDFATCPFTAKSASGVFIEITAGSGRFPIFWQSNKQSSVAQSMPEAEASVIASALFGETLNVQALLEELLQTTILVTFYQDNEALLRILESGYSAKLRPKALRACA